MNIKHLLAVGAIALTSTAMAQQEPVSGTSYYMYNVETGQFLTRGQNWGTQGVMRDYGMPWQVTIADGKYKLQMLDLVVAKSTSGLGDNGFTDNGSPVSLAVSGDKSGYTIAIGATKNSPVDMASSGTWQFLSVDEYKAKIAANTLAQNKAVAEKAGVNGDISELVKGSEWNVVDMTNRIPFPSNSSWTPSKHSSRGGNQNQGNYGVESYQTGDARYTHKVTGLPKGVYKVGVRAMTRSVNNAVNSTVGDAGYLCSSAFFSANGNTVNIQDWYSSRVSESNPNSTGEFVAIANNGGYYQEVFTYVGEDGVLELSAVSEAYWGGSWFLFNGCTLTYYSNGITDEDAAALLATVPSGKMNADVLDKLSNAKTAFENERSLTNYDALAAAIADANASVEVYKNVATINAKAANFDSNGQSAYASTLEAYNNGTLEAGKEVEVAQAAYIAALKSQTTPGTDFTELIVNNSFENGFASGWTNVGMAVQGNTSFPMKDGNNYVEKWQPNGDFSVTQTISDLPRGQYSITVSALARGLKNANVFAGEIKQNMEIADKAADYSVNVMVDEGGSITFGAAANGTGAASSWFAIDNFRLTYVSAEFPELPTAEGKMNKSVKEAMDAAISTYNGSKTVANYNTALVAINAASASVEQYKNNAVALAAQKALVDGTNVYGEGYDAYVTAYEAKQAAYDDCTLNEVVVNPNAATGWRASTDYNFLLTPWTIGDKACNNFENVLYINTWSVEGDTDGSNFTVPFFEYWTEDAKNLANNTIATSLDVENGLYETTVLVRVRATNGVAATDAAGITLSVNGGEAVDVTEGEQVGESQFTISEVKAEGLVKDGKLNIAFNVADANISWLSFKNVKYTKVRDLTPEEEMVVATEEEIAALNAAIEAAEENVIGFKEGNYSPYTNAEAIKALADAKAIDTAEPVPADIVNNAKDALESATWIVNTEEVNAIFNGDFEASYSEKEGTGVTSDRAIYTPEGWTVDYKGDKNDMTILSAGDKADNNFTNITALENGGNHTYLYRGKWGSTTNIDVYQNITLPAGQYYIECDAWKSGLGGDGVVFVDDKKASLDGNDTSWRNLSITFTLEEEKTVKVGFTITHTSDASEKFIGFDNFVLKSMPAIDAAKAELEKAINGVNVPTANVGEGAFQYPAAAIAEINSKIETAKSVLENATSAEEIEAQVEIVNAIEIPALKAPAAGQKFNLILTYSGWTYDNKAITYLANARKDQGNYNIQYLAAANANYAQAFTLTNVEGNKYTMSQLDNDGKERYISTGVPYGGNTGQIRTTTNAEDALVVEVIPTATEGVYNIKNTDANNFIGSQDAGVFTVNSHIDFKIAEAKKATATLKVSDSKYATFIAPFAVAIPAGVKAYTTSALEDNSELVLDEITGTIPANTPVILSAENTPVDKVVSGWGVATTDEYTSGLLTGVYSEVTAPSGSYVLQNQSGRVAFFVVDTEKASPKVTANHAYLTAPASAAKILKFPSDKATSIAEVANPMSNVKAIYSVSGAKVNTLQKGLNIVKYNNGQMKKVYIK